MSTTDPDTAAPSADAERPAEAFPPFTERPPASEVWRRARADYLAGDSAPVVAERYGLVARTVRRRALSEGWRRCDVEPVASHEARFGPSPERERFCEDHEEYHGLDAARDADAASLLFYPSVHVLKDYAFRRASEAAAMDHPLLAASWLRLLRLVDQSHPPYMPPSDTLSAPDHLRAALLRAQRDDDDLLKAFDR